MKIYMKIWNWSQYIQESRLNFSMLKFKQRQEPCNAMHFSELKKRKTEFIVAFI